MTTIEVTGQAADVLQQIADSLAKARKIIVMTGAGISTNTGIPDFRSKDGLYSLIQEQYDQAIANASDRPTLGVIASANRKRPIPETDLDLVSGSLETPAKRRRLALSSPSDTPSSTDGSQKCPDLVNDSDESLASSQDSSFSEDAPSWSLAGRQGPPSLSGHVKGKDLFDCRLWASPLTTSVHYAFIASLRKKIAEDVDRTTPTHHFIRALRDGGRLVRCYTQNVDGLEDREGLSTDIRKGKGSKRRFMRDVVSQARPDRIDENHDMYNGVEVVQLHGDLKMLRCRLCHGEQAWDARLELHLLHGQAPSCLTCSNKVETRLKDGKRSISVGSLRPNIVLYGEEHPHADLLGQITTNDLALRPDALLVLGTSLHVFGFRRLVREFARAVKHRDGKRGTDSAAAVVVFVNRTPPPSGAFRNVITHWINMDCDEWVQDLKRRRDDIFTIQGAPRPPRPPPMPKPVSQGETKPMNNVTVEGQVPRRSRAAANVTKRIRTAEQKAGAAEKRRIKRALSRLDPNKKGNGAHTIPAAELDLRAADTTRKSTIGPITSSPRFSILVPCSDDHRRSPTQPTLPRLAAFDRPPATPFQLLSRFDAFGRTVIACGRSAPSSPPACEPPTIGPVMIPSRGLRGCGQAMHQEQDREQERRRERDLQLARLHAVLAQEPLDVRELEDWVAQRRVGAGHGAGLAELKQEQEPQEHGEERQRDRDSGAESDEARCRWSFWDICMTPSWKLHCFRS